VSRVALVVDLRGRSIETIDDFWDAIAGPAGLPSWFGRNIEAWRDTIYVGGISEVLDSHGGGIIVHVDRTGFFTKKNLEFREFRRTFGGRKSKLIIHDPPA
jgi:Barstar (barnase inhibitor)